MTDCRLTIFSRGRGWQNNLILPARMQGQGQVKTVYYTLEGDSCTLTLSPRRIEQQRSGGVNIKLTFVQGQKTACVIGDGGLRGGYPIFTEHLGCTVKSLGAAATIHYLSGSDSERITVNIRVTAINK